MVENIARYGLGLIFLVFGFNYFLQFLPTPEMGPDASQFMMALFNTGYMFPLIKVMEIIVAILFLANRYVTFATVLIAPIVVNILLFHVFLNPPGLVVGGLVTIFLGMIMFNRRDQYQRLFCDG